MQERCEMETAGALRNRARDDLSGGRVDLRPRGPGDTSGRAAAAAAQLSDRVRGDDPAARSMGGRALAEAERRALVLPVDDPWRSDVFRAAQHVPGFGTLRASVGDAEESVEPRVSVDPRQ